MKIYNKKILEIMDEAIASKEVPDKSSFLISIGYTTPTNLHLVASGKLSFKIDHMIAAAKKYNVSMDWICGLSNDKRLTPSKDPIENLKDAVEVIAKTVSKSSKKKK